MDCCLGWVVRVLPLIFLLFSCLFHNWNLGSICTYSPLNCDLGQVKITVSFYLIYGMMDRVGSTCSTYRSFFNIKAVFTFLADYAKMMFVYMYSSDFGNIF